MIESSNDRDSKRLVEGQSVKKLYGRELGYSYLPVGCYASLLGKISLYSEHRKRHSKWPRMER